MSASRERRVTEVFVSLASSLASGYDVTELLSRLTADCTELIDIEAAGLVLADNRGVLHVLAASTEAARKLEAFQIQREQGPCRDCFESGVPVLVPDLEGESGRWPEFVPRAVAVGFASVHALPMRLRDTTLGALGLFGNAVGSLGDDDLLLAQALADVASVALIQDKAASDSAAVNEQLQRALSSRVALEQAKGILAQRGDLDVEDAFAVLRRYSRDHNLRLSDVAAAVVSRQLAAQDVLTHGANRPK